MLLRRRASLQSASDLPRRVRAEVAANSVHIAGKHRVLSTVVSFSTPSALLLARAMHTSSPRPPPAKSPTADYKWKRGRPVTARSSSAGQTNRGLSLCMPVLPEQLVVMNSATLWGGQTRQTSTTRHVESPRGEDVASSTIDAVKQMHLWDPSKPLRFAPTEYSEGSDSMANDNNDIVPKQESDIQSVGEDMTEMHVPLAYQIPEDTLRTTMLASPNTRASYWSTKLYKGPLGETLPIHYCRSMEVAERVAQYFLKEKVVGFDIEWNPRARASSIKQNASLIQLACGDRIALFHISLFPGITAKQLIPPSLRVVLESPEIMKVGVAVKGDFTRLEKHLDIHAQGVFELSRLHNLVEWYETDPSKVSNRLVGLAAQVLQHLQLPLYKGGQLDDEPDNTSSVRESDWSQPLDLQQIHYAAADAYAGFRLYHVLEWKRKQLRPIPSAIQLCDYDSKPAPRSKEPRKKTKIVSKPKGTTEAVTGRTVEVVEPAQEEGEDEEGYETAPEEFMDSHQLEDPAPKPLTNTSGEAVDIASDAAPTPEGGLNAETEYDGETAQTYNRVGRVNLSQLRGPDPAYPALPQDVMENVSRPSSVQSFYHFSTAPADSSIEEELHSTRPPESEVDAEDDEFADPELEEALKALVLSDDGKLTNDTVEAILEMTTERDAQMAHTIPSTKVDKAIPTGVKNHGKTEFIELSDFNPVSLETKDADTATTPTFKPLVALSDEVSRTPEYHLATTWAQNYLTSTIPSPTSTVPSRIRATVPHLRAYHLWHHQKLSLDEIGKHLRDPPLSHSTVTSYILQAISLERLKYEKEALKDVMMAMPSGLRKGRWKWLAQTVGALG
ncbi:uncharacterized protein K460DRAFT_416948 [Cucurbitaria berberidis CBS 394.84]|uniref:3'-5' exonuclease domain-containing protein n=1 Tax=Cucurbitaria berberidis CBS 394.84 TaxID=1168544 RepID=A0A9P4GIH4_9PLEO|nr:uncharacterized protein K460DRAFT_416948 [Cucurbitaria berberidis CBS 394.84]KAF1845740.1 hypothetical protein K460DRAFT_416948 [Cucurbitaria berberidis CBS 394.84]